MWSRLDDGIISHPKVLDAGARLGKQGVLVALGAVTWGIVYSNHNLTDGALLRSVVATMPTARPFDVAAELVRVGLWEMDGDDYRIHDFADWNARAADVKRKRAADRERKRNLDGIHADSERIPNGFQTTTVTRIPDDASRARASHPIPSHPNQIPTEPKGARDRPTPIAGRMNPNVSFAGRPNVPAFLHAKFRAKLVGPEDECDQRLRDWYGTTADAWENKPIGDDDIKFWEARFREWVGTTVAPVHASPREQTKEEFAADVVRVQRERAARQAARS